MKVISGGQTGADLAGLDAAKNVGFRTGGWMPKYWMNIDGKFPEYAEKYGMQEHASVGYAPRTKQNVFDSDGTVVISGNMKSPGTKMTIFSAKKFSKHIYIVNAKTYNDTEHNNIANWIINNKIQILNVAGNSEHNFLGIYKYSYDLLIRVFEIVRMLRLE